MRRRSKRTSKHPVTGLCEGNPPLDFAHKRSVTRKMFLFHDVIMDDGLIHIGPVRLSLPRSVNLTTAYLRKGLSVLTAKVPVEWKKSYCLARNVFNRGLNCIHAWNQRLDTIVITSFLASKPNCIAFKVGSISRCDLEHFSSIMAAATFYCWYLTLNYTHRFTISFICHISSEYSNWNHTHHHYNHAVWFIFAVVDLWNFNIGNMFRKKFHMGNFISVAF